jgi:hypothetical protein
MVTITSDGTAPADTDVRADPPRTAVPGLGGRIGRWLPAAAALAAIVAMLLNTHTPMADTGRYAVYVGWGLILPGTLVYRSLRRTPHTLVEDLAMGTTIGLVLEIGAWAAFSSVRAQGLLWLWPTLVVVPFLTVGPLRRHWRVTGYRPTPLGWSWAVSGMVVFLVGYVYVSYFRQTEPVPTSRGGAWYHIDLPYMLSLVGEAKHHFPVHNPQVASEPLYYHWFSYAHMASASLISGVDTPMVFFRLASPVFCALAVVTLAVAGWRVSGKPWVGALAALLTFVVGEFSLVNMSWGMFGGVTAYMVWSSHSLSYSWPVTFALMVVVVELLRPKARDAPLRPKARDAPLGRGAWVLLALLLIGAGGSKSTIIPVLLGGLGVAGLAGLVATRRVDRRLVCVGSVVAAGGAFAAVVIYRFESHGLRLGPLADFGPYVMVGHPRSTWRTVAVYGFVGAAYLLFLYVRLAGIPVLAWLRRPWGHVEWFLFGSLLAGGVAALTFTHPGISQNFFIRTSFGFGAVLSAMGFAALVERHRVSARTLVPLFAAISAGVSVLTVVLQRHGFAVAIIGWRGVLPITSLALAIAGLAALGAVVWFVALRRRWAGVAGVALLSTILLAGAPNLVVDARQGTLFPPRWYHSHVTPEEASAARWLRDHTSPDDVIATNQHCLPELAGPLGCPSQSFWLSAYSERRQLVGSWAYVPRAVDLMATQTTPVPFWDPQLLADNDIVFTAPTVERVNLLVTRYDVHWLVVDRAQGRESDALLGFADLRYMSGPIAIYQIR